MVLVSGAWTTSFVFSTAAKRSRDIQFSKLSALSLFSS